MSFIVFYSVATFSALSITMPINFPMITRGATKACLTLDAERDEGTREEKRCAIGSPPYEYILLN